MSFTPTSPFWISDAGTGVSTLYNGFGVRQALVVTIPGPGGTAHGVPTGQRAERTTTFIPTNEKIATTKAVAILRCPEYRRGFS
jgi:hypothetical protein